MPKKKPYFHNNWQLYKDADESFFLSHTFDEFMEWKLGGWELPSSVCCIIRETDPKTKKVKEHVYSKKAKAEDKGGQKFKSRKQKKGVKEDEISG